MLTYDEELYDDQNDEWSLIDVKSVKDWDDFWTDYTLWYNEVTDEWVCIFGDRDLYHPENSDYDMEFDSESEARSWFENYQGAEEEDVYGATDEIAVGLESMTSPEIVQFLYDAFLAADPSHEEIDIYAYEANLQQEYDAETQQGWFVGSYDEWLVDRAQDVIDSGYVLSDEFLDNINSSRRIQTGTCNDKPVDDTDAKQNITSSSIMAGGRLEDDLDVLLGELGRNISKIRNDVDKLTPAGVDSFYEEIYKMNRKIKQLMRIHF